MSQRIARRPDPELDALVRRARPGRKGYGKAAQAARAKLVAKYHRLVDTIAAGFGRPEIHDDLVQAGLVDGLLYAITKYDPTAGSNFTSYAYLWIRAAVQQELTLHTPVMRIHRGVGHNQTERVKREARKLEAKNGRTPTAAEVKAAIGDGRNAMSLAQVETALERVLPSAVPHDRLERVSVGSEDEMIDAIDGRHRDREVQAALAGLTPREQAVIQLRYVQDMTARDTAVKLGVGVEVVRNAEYAALAKLREALG